MLNKNIKYATPKASKKDETLLLVKNNKTLKIKTSNDITGVGYNVFVNGVLLNWFETAYDAKIASEAVIQKFNGE